MSSFARSESGTSIIEFSVAMPFLVLLLFGTVDLGRAIERHMALNRVVYEGLRYAATLSSLEPGTYSEPKTEASVQNQLRERIQLLSKEHGLGDNTEGITTQLFSPKAEAEVDREDELLRTRVVCIAMRRPFTPLFSPLGNIATVAARACGPYLFPESS